MHISLISIVGLFLITYSSKNFPDRKDVLVNEFAVYDNFFPIATLDLSENGIKDRIHIIYVSFNYSGPREDLNFPNGEDMDHFTFEIESRGLYRPTFKREAMKIDSQYLPYFQKGSEKFAKIKADNNNVDGLFQMRYKPDWLQNDATPHNSKGKPFRFICQFEMEELFTDDSWVYVFYDKVDRQVKYVHQRT